MIEIWKHWKEFGKGSWSSHRGIYELSNIGRIRHNGVIVDPIISGDRCFITTSTRLHIEVFKLFEDYWWKGCDVHHIDSNSKNNSITNLVALSHSDHAKVHAKLSNLGVYERTDIIKNKISCSLKGTKYKKRMPSHDSIR